MCYFPYLKSNYCILRLAYLIQYRETIILGICSRTVFKVKYFTLKKAISNMMSVFPSPPTCYRQGRWGLVATHYYYSFYISKTISLPPFSLYQQLNKCFIYSQTSFHHSNPLSLPTRSKNVTIFFFPSDFPWVSVTFHCPQSQDIKPMKMTV